MKQYNESKTPESEKDSWRTPPEVLEAIYDRFGFDGFDIDLCASEDNAVSEYWFSNFNHVSIIPPGVYEAWINPPFSRKNLIKTAIEHLDNGSFHSLFALIPDKPETKLFQELERRSTYVCRFNKRINFLRPDGSKVGQVPFASVVFVFHRVYVPGMCQQARLEI